MQFLLNENGSLKKLKWGNDFEVPFRDDCYSGPVFYEKCDDTDIVVSLEQREQGYFEKEHNGCRWSLLYEEEKLDGNLVLKITAEIKRIADSTYVPQMAGIQLGIDCYMDSYPQWNTQLFPTMLRCEKTHFWGYMMSPKSKIMGLASPDPVACWNL